MEATITERVGESSSRRRLRRKQSRKCLAESPPSQVPRGSQKKRKHKEEGPSDEKDSLPEGFWKVRAILDEKIERGVLRYLVDWEDDHKTGESYKPTWEPYDLITEDTIDEWEEKKRLRRIKGRRSLETSPQPASSFDPSSQPKRTTKRKRAQLPSSSSIPSSQPLPKKPRRAGTAETARFQSVSQETVGSEGKPKEIKDSYEEQSVSDGSGRIRVEVPIDEAFDREAYATTTVVSSQPSQTIQLSQLSHSVTPSRSQSKSFTSRRFIWDEPDVGEESGRVPIIPDSQFLPGSSSYVPSQTQASYTGVTAQPDTGTHSDLALASPSPRTSIAAAANSGGSTYRYSESQNHSYRTSDSEKSELISSPTHGREQIASSDPHQPSTHLDRSQESYILQPSSDFLPLRDPKSSSVLHSQPGTSNSPVSTDLPTISQERLPSPSRQSLSQEGALTLSQVQSRQPSYSVSDESSTQFQTQVPLATQNDASSETLSDHVRPTVLESLEGISNRYPIQSKESQSQLSGPQSLIARSVASTQKSISSFEATWQAAQVQSASPRVESHRAQQERTFSESDQQISLRHTQDATPLQPIWDAPGNSASSQVHTQEGLASLEQNQQSSLRYTYNATSQASPPLSSIGINTQKSASKSQACLSPEVKSDSKVNKRDRQSEQPSETVLPSIEAIAHTISSPSSEPPPSSGVITASQQYPLSTRSSRSPGMADQAMGEISTAERLRRARIAAAEATMAEQRAARTASAIPHTPPPPAPPINQMLPLRESAPEAPVVAEAAPSPKASPEQDEESTKGLQLLPLGDNVFTIPLPMTALSRDIYDQEITNHQPQRRSFLNDEVIDMRLVDDIDKMLERLQMICDHQDLIDADSASQALEPYSRQAKWAENISTKCIFLAEFLDSLRRRLIDTHIVVFVRPGRMTDILESVFRVHDYCYRRPDRSQFQRGQGRMKISLLPTNINPRDLRDYGVGPAALVIAFDSTFVNGPQVDSLRMDPLNPQRLAPLAHLVITHSIEHLDLCIKKDMNELDRKQLLVNALSLLRQDVGILNPNYPSPDAAAKALSDFIARGAREWPLFPMPDIEDVPVTIAEEAQRSGSTTQSYDASSNVFKPTFKRPLFDEEDSESSKRQRLTPVGGVRSGGVDVSRINETILGTTDMADAEVKQTPEIIAKANVLDETQNAQVSSLLKKINELEIQLRAKESTEAELRQSNKRLQAKCNDYERSIDKIVPKYQEALNERGQAAHDIQESMARETSMRQKLDARTSELSKVREQKALVDAELAEARIALSSSSIPEVAELQKVKDELRAAQFDLEKAQKKLASAQSDVDYMRSNYQEASSAAAEMRSELDELKAKNVVLARKADDNAVEIHRIQASNDIKEYLQLISELEVEKAGVERELEKKAEELRTLLNGRRTTRGTSVPRSPRMGTMSPGQSSRPMSRVLGGVGSRGSSPAPGGSESGFRGPGTFGDALYPGVANRFPHLS